MREERLAAEFFDRHRVARGQAVLRTHHEHQLVAQDGERFEPLVGGLEGHEREVEVAV